MLEFIGLGLYDEHSITRRGANALTNADRAYLEGYTSVLTGTDVATLEATHGTEITVLDRAAVEQAPEPILDAAQQDRVAFLTAGDPMIATTHVDLRLRAHERDIDTRIHHGTSAATAAAGLTGLQQYRFGQSTTIPFPDQHGHDGIPPSVIRVIQENLDRDLHTLVFLDLNLDDANRTILSSDLDERCLSADRAAAVLKKPLEDRLAIAIARAGSDDPLVHADTLSALAERSFGPPLHLLVIPGALHDMEAAALEAFADASSELLTEAER